MPNTVKRSTKATQKKADSQAAEAVEFDPGALAVGDDGVIDDPAAAEADVPPANEPAADNPIESDTDSTGTLPAMEIVIRIPAPSEIHGLASRDAPGARLTRLQAVGQKYLRTALSDSKIRVPGGPGSHPEGPVADGLRDATRYLYQQVGEQVLQHLGMTIEEARDEFDLTF